MTDNKTQSAEDRGIFTIELKPAATEMLTTLNQPALGFHASLLNGVEKFDFKMLVVTWNASAPSLCDLDEQ